MERPDNDIEDQWGDDDELAPPRKQAKTGRPAGNLRSHFTGSEQRIHNRPTSATCNYCSADLSNTRMETLQQHLLELCREVPAEIKAACEQEVAAKFTAPATNLAGRAARSKAAAHKPGQKAASSSGASSGTQSTLTRQLTKGMRAKMDALLGRWVVSAGVAFNALDDPTFVDFVNEMLPNYQPPGKQRLTTVHACVVPHTHTVFYAQAQPSSRRKCCPRWRPRCTVRARTRSRRWRRGRCCPTSPSRWTAGARP